MSPAVQATTPGGTPTRSPDASPIPSKLPVWTTIAWREADPRPFSGPGNQYILGAVASSDGYILVGEEAPLPSGTVAGVVWRSPDGLHWQRIPNDGVFNGAEIDAVAARGSTLVAAGISRFDDPAQQLTPPVGLAWRSSDGTRWQRLPDTSGILGTTVLFGIVAGPSGFVAYGRDLAAVAPAILFSSDGMHWEPVAAGVFAGATVASMTATSGGFAAVGSRAPVPPPNGPPGPAAAWWSADGRTWHASDVGSGGYALGMVQPWAGSLRATGSGACGGCVGPLVEWRSGDGGRTWRQLPPSATPASGQTASTALLVDGRVVELRDQPWVADWTADGQSWQPLALTGSSLPDRLELEIAAGPTVVAVAPFYVLPLPTGRPDDQVDMRVFVGVLR